MRITTNMPRVLPHAPPLMSYPRALLWSLKAIFQEVHINTVLLFSALGWAAIAAVLWASGASRVERVFVLAPWVSMAVAVQLFLWRDRKFRSAVVEEAQARHDLEVAARRERLAEYSPASSS